MDYLEKNWWQLDQEVESYWVRHPATVHRKGNFVYTSVVVDTYSKDGTEKLLKKVIKKVEKLEWLVRKIGKVSKTHDLFSVRVYLKKPLSKAKDREGIVIRWK